MPFDNDFVAAKLRRWEKYLENFKLPAWEEIPDFGLYMEQITQFLKQCLDYLPPELKEEQFITASTINNYVRTKVMPEPIKKRYYRTHIAYLIIILTLKQSLSIALIQRIIPMNIPEEKVKEIYTAYVNRHKISAKYFIEQVRLIAGPILHHDDNSVDSVEKTEDLITTSAIMGGFTRLLAEKLLLIENVSSEDNKE